MKGGERRGEGRRKGRRSGCRGGGRKGGGGGNPNAAAPSLPTSTLTVNIGDDGGSGGCNFGDRDGGGDGGGGAAVLFQLLLLLLLLLLVLLLLLLVRIKYITNFLVYDCVHWILPPMCVLGLASSHFTSHDLFLTIKRSATSCMPARLSFKSAQNQVMMLHNVPV